MLIPYDVSTDPSLKGEMEEFERKIREVHANPNRWAKYGVEYKKDPNASTVLHYILTPAEFIEKKGMKGLSYYDPKTVEIRINYDNWMGKSKGNVNWFKSVDEYRTYVINHETGHYIWDMHGAHGNAHLINKRDKKGPCPVMIQQTKGREHCEPYDPNPYPIEDDMFVFSSMSGGGYEKKINIVLIIIVMIVLMFIFFGNYSYYIDVVVSTLNIMRKNKIM